MSDDDFDLDAFVSDTSKAEQVSGGNLRKLLEQALKAKAESDERIKQLEADAAKRSVTDTWNSLGVPEAIRKTYRGPLDESEIRSWWEESKGLYNLDAAEGQVTETAEQTEAQQNLAAVQAASSLGSTSDSGWTAALAKGADIRDKVSSGSASQADLDDFFKLAGIPRG